MDTFTLYAAINELKPTVIGARINKIYQPTRDFLLLKLSTKQDILISIDSSFSAVFPLKSKLPNPVHPSSFCMVLRKYIENGMVTDIFSLKFYRIFFIKIQRKEKIFILKINLSSKTSNIFLIGEDNIIIANYKKFSNEQEENITKLTKFQFADTIKQKKNIAGFPSFITKELYYITEKDGIDTGYEKYSNLFEFSFTPKPCIVNNKIFPFPLEHIKHDNLLSFDLFSDAFNYILNTVKFQKLKVEAKKILNKKIKKINKILSSIDKEAKEKENFAALFKFGELLKANMHLIKKGDTSVKVTDYYDTAMPEIEIPLKSDKSPLENIENYFKKAKKGKRGIEKLKNRKQEIKKSLDYLSETMYFVENSKNLNELLDILPDITENFSTGIVRKDTSDRKKSAQFNKIEFNGNTVVYGKTNRGNDYIRKNFGKPDYIWLHVHNYPGSHVIICKSKENIDTETLLFAAKTALQNSKAKNNIKGEVIYTELKYVKKIKGSPPGMVTVTKFKTVTVELR